MSTIELVDPELREALALAPQLPLTAESLMQRRANALELIGAVPKPNLPDIATDEISCTEPKRAAWEAPLIFTLTFHGGGFVMGAPEMKGCGE
jgi:hypothetical protein